MGFFRKVINKLTIDFYNQSEAALRFENLDGQWPDGLLIRYYFLTYYAKILYNYGSIEEAQDLILSIVKGFEAALNRKDKIDKSLEFVEYRGKGAKIYVAEWDKKGTITTKMSLGQERHYGKASVLLFLDYLNRTLDEPDRRKLFLCLYLFLGVIDNQGIPKGVSGVRDTHNWSVEIVHEIEANPEKYERMIREELGEHSKKPAQDAKPDLTDAISQLERLARLKEQGFLTEEEFQAQKKLLGF